MQNKLDGLDDAIRSIDSSKEYLWPRIVMLMFDNGKLSEEQAIYCLRYIYGRGENARNTPDEMRGSVHRIQEVQELAGAPG